MKVLLVGGGGREHALAWKLCQSPRLTQLYCAPGNGGMAALGEIVPYAATDVENIAIWAKEHAMDFVFVASDDPLALGLVDLCRDAGLRVFGPTKAAARLESSKIFSKNLMRRYNIPTAAFESFEDVNAAIAYAKEQTKNGEALVIKADGLALGKGAVIVHGAAEAEMVLRDCMEGGRFKASGRRVVIEAFMEGREITALCFTDGKTLAMMPSARDYKRAFDGDKGPNTGGMGVISPVADYTPELAARCEREIFRPTLQAMEAEGCPFAGVLYFEMMLTTEGPKVIEYNARFGDPEAQVLLPLLETDLLDICDGVIDGQLDSVDIQWSSRASACVVMASGGYPGTVEKGYPITGIENLPKGTLCFQAGTKQDENGRLLTAGGRVLAVSATAETLPEALQLCYEGVGKIQFTDMFWRNDIGR